MYFVFIPSSPFPPHCLSAGSHHLSPDFLQQPLNGSPSTSFILLVSPDSTPFRVHFIKPKFDHVTLLLKNVSGVLLPTKSSPNSLKAWFSKCLAIWPTWFLPMSSPVTLPHPSPFSPTSLNFSLLPESPCTEQKTTARELFSRVTAEHRTNQTPLRNNNNNHNLPF